MAAAATFASLAAALKSDPSLGKKVNGTLRFDLSTGSETVVWLVDCKAGEVTQGAASARADVTIRMKEADFVSLAAGKLSGASAYMTGKMKIKGKVALAQKFSELASAARKQKGSKPAAPAAPAASTPAAAAPAPSTEGTSHAPPAGFASNAVFERMINKIRSDPAVLKKVNGSFCFRVGGPKGAKATWSVYARVGDGRVVAAEPESKADCTITISDPDLVALASGKLSAMSAYMSGKLKVSGKASLAQKLAALLDSGKPASKL
jgi:putative sterol carrier protein